MKTATIILVGSISCLVGCDSQSPTDGDVSTTPSRAGYFVSTNIIDIVENIRVMCESLEKKGPTSEYSNLVMNFYKSMTNITDAATLVTLCDARLDALFDVDFSHFSYEKQSTIEEMIGRSVDQVFRYMKNINLPRAKWRDLGFEKDVEYRIKHLKWKRRLIKRLHPKHRVENITTVPDIDADRERSFWSHLYYDGMDEYEYRLRNIEHTLPCWANIVSSNSFARAKSMVEEYIGRPIRSEVQCREDARLKRHVEFFETRDPHAAP